MSHFHKKVKYLVSNGEWGSLERVVWDPARVISSTLPPHVFLLQVLDQVGKPHFCFMLSGNMMAGFIGPQTVALPWFWSKIELPSGLKQITRRE